MKVKPPTYLKFDDAGKIIYSCGFCGQSGVKLWRDYQTFLSNQELRCANCVAKLEQEKKGLAEAPVIGRDGRWESEYGKTDQIGGLVPACLDEIQVTFWGYTSVPMLAICQWRALPTYPDQEPLEPHVSTFSEGIFHAAASIARNGNRFKGDPEGAMELLYYTFGHRYWHYYEDYSKHPDDAKTLRQVFAEADRL